MEELKAYKYAIDESAIVAITDQKGLIIHVNDNFCKISKYSREELLGKDHRIINSGFHPKEFIATIWKTIANGQTWKGELKNKAKDGTMYWVDTTIVPFLNRDGKPYQYVAIRSDITSRKNAEEKLAKNAKSLAYKNTQLVDFCNIVSHNLRGPLINISMLVDYLEQIKTDEQRKEVQAKIKPVINHLLEVFNELVESLQVQQDKDLVLDKIELQSCLEKILVGFETQIVESGASIQVDFTKAPTLNQPSKYIESVFFNLISNALKYKASDRTPSIKIDAVMQANSVLLSVSDNGLGIDLVRHKDQLFKIRKVFHKHADAKGFGLFMTKTHIEAMGGTIRAESKPGVGSTFFIELPKNIQTQ